jgi:hypothetical protein
MPEIHTVLRKRRFRRWLSAGAFKLPGSRGRESHLMVDLRGERSMSALVTHNQEATTWVGKPMHGRRLEKVHARRVMMQRRFVLPGIH